MPEKRTGLGRWIVIGRALPRRTRERIFEPAFYDMLRRCLESSPPSAVGFGSRTLALFAGSFAVAARRVLLSRPVIIGVGGFLVVAAVGIMLLQSWIGHVYAE